MPEREWDEIVRLRDKLHDKVEPALATALLQLSALESRLDTLEPQVRSMAEAEKIADAVADKMHERRGELLSGWQKLGAGAVGLVALADFVRGIVMGL